MSNPNSNINYIAILSLAVVCSIGLLLGSRGVYGWNLGAAPKTNQIAPAMVQLAQLAAVPTTAPEQAVAEVESPAVPEQIGNGIVADGRQPLPRVFFLNDIPYTVDIVDGAGYVQVGEAWYSCAGQGRDGLAPAQALNVLGLCGDQGAW